jgi:hypothetical protein
MGGYFCRNCLGNPAYESQLRNDKARGYLRAYRLRERLGGSRPVIDPIPARRDNDRPDDPLYEQAKTYWGKCLFVRSEESDGWIIAEDLPEEKWQVLERRMEGERKLWAREEKLWEAAE